MANVVLIGAALSADQRSAERDFVLKVLPQLKSKCFGYHGDDLQDVKGAFDVRNREAMLKGGASDAAAVVPGRPEDSALYQAIRWEGRELTPKPNDRLTTDQIEPVRRWIETAAPRPAAEIQRGALNFVLHQLLASRRFPAGFSSPGSGGPGWFALQPTRGGESRERFQLEWIIVPTSWHYVARVAQSGNLAQPRLWRDHCRGVLSCH